jgi:hypothetical protein
VDPQLLTTYRYLRLSLVTVLAMLALAVLLEMAGGRFQPSISDYYWTPVRSVFVGSLVALGVGMVVIKADNELEDILLNAGGVLAPVVAFVPTPDVGTCTTFQPSLSQDTVAAIGNNVGALLGAGLLAFVVHLALTRGRPRTPVPASVRRARVIGTVVTGLLLAGGFVWFRVDRPSFDCGAHFAAAIPLFGCIIGVAVLNAVTRTQEHLAQGLPLARSIRNRYTVIVVLIVLVLLAAIPVQLGGSRFTVLFLEAGVLLFFLVFWILQSAELWDRGRRDREISVLPRRPISRPPRS